MSDREQAADLLHVADRELRALKGMSDAEIFSDEVFGFIAQQAAEKSLKAWLSTIGQTYPLTHDLTDLLTHLEDAGHSVGPFWDLVDLNPFAVQLRYTSLGLMDTPLDREVVIRQVEAVVEEARKFVEPSPH